ncbi:putative heterodimeric geranylgeranyl pyrophosphate synthase small subunit, chloroplastic [Cocos nucifera]|uniref:Putative heterodimeric geranylgeranyl pyrophosphate synthase small subunit, chloroplastic n=1 Tax=Cocos nucifera TaxID=13894 RepID=A0A8K0N6B3_COCNU|nr:putative heterodimeric geranylgeranyl pyrophosphate synthase small subunit, chloroplastic [Cocos nucifera]
MVAAAASHRQGHWASIEADIRTHLLQSLPTTPLPVVVKPMHHMINSAVPKPIAPVLCLTACELVGGQRTEAMDAACALHLMHALVRSRARFHPVLGLRAENKSSSPFSDGVLLMTGDGLVSFGFELVARSESSEPSRVLKVILEIAEAIGAAGTAEGLNMVADGATAVEKVCEKTDARLSACGAVCGAILGGAGDEAVERLRRFGLYVGMMHGLLCTEGSSEAAEEFRSLARSELKGFEEGKLDEVRGLVDWWYEQGAVAAVEAARE